MIDEHQSFAKLIASLEMAKEAADELKLHRLDQPWEKVGENLNQMKELVFRMVGSGFVKGVVQ